MDPELFQALRTHQADNGGRSLIETLRPSGLTAGDLLVRTRWAGVNYKDSLAVTGRAGVLKGSPRIAGIELVGTVQSSESPGFEPGDEVLVHGFETGIAYDGGFSEFVKVPQSHAMRIPAGLDPFEAAVLGVPGFTVALALDRFESLGLHPDSGSIALSGATGAVGLLAVAILGRLGYRVVALTRRDDFAESLRELGAAEVLTTSGLAAEKRPLEKARFAAAIDNVGGDILSWLLRSLQPQGCLASVGNASGIEFSTNVLPFLLRQVHLFGVVANAPWPERHRLWKRLAGDWKPDLARFMPHVRQIRLQDLQEHCRRQVAGTTSGRTLVAFR